ncbi:MAG: hypothetical protein WCI72_01835 [archaeon]
MVSKRGMLAIDEVIKIILGVAVFIFIIFLLFAFGKIVSNTLREEQAQSTLSRVVYEIENLKDGVDKEVLIEGPANWFFYSSGDKFCIISIKCLDALNKISLSEIEASSGKKNLLTLCKSSGFCNSSMNVTIPYDYVDYKTGYRINHYAQYLFGSSKLTMANLVNALLIGEKTIPQTIKLRRVDDQTTMIDVPSTKELSSITSLIQKANELPIGTSYDLGFMGVENEYLSAASIDGGKINLICLCDSKDKNICEKNGLCMVSDMKLVLVDTIQLPKKTPSLKITKIDSYSFKVALA